MMLKLLACSALAEMMLGTVTGTALAQSKKDADNESSSMEIYGRAEVVSSVVVDGNTNRGRRFNGNASEIATVKSTTSPGNVGYVQISGVSDEVKRIAINAPSTFILTHDAMYNPADPNTYVDGSINILDKEHGQFPTGMTAGDLFINFDVQNLKGRLNGSYSAWLPIAITFCAY